MSEYTIVERSILDKLRQLGWEIIDHTSAALRASGTGFIPQNPAVSKREHFKK